MNLPSFISRQIFMRRISLGVLVLIFSSQLLGCVPARIEETRTPEPITKSSQDSGLYIIPFFTTETDPDQLAVLRKLIDDYQRSNPNVEVDIVLASPASRGRRLLTALNPH
jgi:ABC-type glycerol-3-phosphate transport system substrate-binding protein